MKDIVVGIDFTGADDMVLKAIVPFAKALGATLHLVHVERALSEWTEYSMIGVRHAPEEQRKLTEENEEKMARLVAPLKGAGVAVSTSIELGEPLDALLEAVEKSGSPLLVVGSHSRNTIERAFLGHVTDKLLKKATVPVMVVPTFVRGGDGG